MPETKIDNDAAVREARDALKDIELTRRLDEKNGRPHHPVQASVFNQIHHHLALEEAARGLAKEIPRWILEHGLKEVDNAAGDDDDLSCLSCHQTAHEWRSIEHENGKYCHVGRITRAFLTLEALLPTKEG